MVVIRMKIAHTSTDFDSKKRALQRRETTEAYRKTSQYQSKKNPLLEALENLLSGKTEKELNQIDSQTLAQASQKALNESPAENVEELPKQELFLQLPKVNIGALEQTNKPVEDSLTGAVSYKEDTLEILEQVHTTAGETVQQQLKELQTAEEDAELFANIDTKVDVPERFLNDFSKRDASASTVFGHELESLIYNRVFSKATSKYNQHIAMVKNGYRSFDEPAFSKTA